MKDWKSLAECKKYDPDWWFPDYYQGMTERRRKEIEAKAKAICAICPVRVQCLNYALLLNEPDGIWGGKSALERKYIRNGKRRNRA